MEIWEKPLSDGAKAVGLFNRGESASPITLDLKSVGFGDAAKLHDIWAGKDVMRNWRELYRAGSYAWGGVAEDIEVVERN